MDDFLTHGSKCPLVKISKEEQLNNLNSVLTFGNHKGTSTKPELLLKLIGKMSNMATASPPLLTA
jgi:hypothetical protein